MPEGVINSSLMSKINNSRNKMARRNIFLIFAAKEDEERLCKSLLSESGSNEVGMANIAGVLGIGGILSAMGIDPSSLTGNVDVRCLSIVKTISFESLPDAMTLAIAQVASVFNITRISEVSEVKMIYQNILK